MQGVIQAPRPETPHAGSHGELQGHAESLHTALSELVRVYQFRDRDRICCHDISVTQCYALEALLRRGPCGLNELAAELCLDKSTASRVVAALQRKRYVARAPHPEDGRAVVLTVTPAGRRLHGRIRSDLVAETKLLVEDFEPGVREAAARLILRLARATAARSGVTTSAACCPVPDEQES
jgi:MarR family transcriptional regulator, 2-MHQ and catechol-resistance regulon repressor